ncbi:MAG TPA: hypothetical protein DET40_17940 [Lentisphaeria bacterium]|nr:MAG: hypothetical protein A2X45_02075 [Lentisphaerae bacterium GWF2_50_93]HCE45424.1 hypothetical protein [Lentisphaeria bacterium]
MTFLRRIIRFPAILVWFAITGIYALFIGFGSRKGIKRVTKVAMLWGAGNARIINMNIKVVGDPHKIEGGIIVSNHLSYLDILAHAAVFRLRFTPKADIARWPFLGWFIYVSRPIWVNRESRQESHLTLRKYKETLEDGINLIVYPEGTSSDGKGILPFKSTPFEAVVSGNFKIHPILTRYVRKPDEPTLCWYGGMTLVPHCWYVLGRKSTEVEIHILQPILSNGKNRKELARFVHDYMEKEYEKL